MICDIERTNGLGFSAEQDEQRTVYLEPFIHQVGGHVSMLSWDDTTVSKPYSGKEHEFYESMPEHLRRFVPEYRGMIEVGFEEDTNGYLNLTAYPPASKSEKAMGLSLDLAKFKNKSRSTRVRLKRSGSIELETCSHIPDMFEDVEKCQLDKQNPWAIRCHTSHIAKLRSSDHQKHHFILLENLAFQFRRPCILDLKMGFQQHSDDASEAKRLAQVRKCQRSTSAKLGVRMCGMQVYHRTSGVYKCLSKYYGRMLDVAGFHDVLLQFFDNGAAFRFDLIDPFLQRLSELKEAVQNSDGARFYSSSLLLMYDGHEDTFAASSAAETAKSASLRLSTTAVVQNSVSDVCVSEASSVSSSDAAEICPCSAATSPVGLSAANSSAQSAPGANRPGSASSLIASQLLKNLMQPEGLIVSAPATASTSSNNNNTDIPLQLSLATNTSSFLCDKENKNSNQGVKKPISPRKVASEASFSAASGGFVCPTCGATVSRKSAGGNNSGQKVTLSPRLQVKSGGGGRTPVSSGPSIDVRMIDFEHTTVHCPKSKKGPLSYSGPDHGYIAGLENLIHILLDIREELRDGFASPLSSAGVCSLEESI